MYYLVKQASGDLDIFETHCDCDTVVHFIETVHKDPNDDGRVMQAIMNREIREWRSKDTSIAHIRTRIVAASEDKEALIGAAAMEIMIPVASFNQFTGINEWIP